MSVRTRPRARLGLPGSAGVLVAAAAVGTAGAYVASRTEWSYVPDAPAQVVDLVRRMWPPALGYARELLAPFRETIAMATLGTILAVAIGTPLSFLAARNTSPHPAVRRAAVAVAAATRSVNSLVWALVLVAVVGPGPLAGTLALALRSIGFVVKLLFEAIEEIDARPVEAVAASGASSVHVFAWGVAPQVFPAFVGVGAFRWDINLREAAIVGLVGAGGIGVPLDACVASLQWSKAAVILLALVALVVLGETVSAIARRRTH